MPTTLYHNGQGIPGIYENPHVSALESQNSRTKFQGVHGVSEIRGGRGGRVIQLTHQFFNGFNTEANWNQAWIALNKRTNDHGTLELRGNLLWYLQDVTFEGVELVFGPLPDAAGAQDGGWWSTLLLTFYQTSIEGD